MKLKSITFQDRKHERIFDCILYLLAVLAIVVIISAPTQEEIPVAYTVRLELRQVGDALVVDFGSLEIGERAYKIDSAFTHIVGDGEYTADLTFYGPKGE